MIWRWLIFSSLLARTVCGSDVTGTILLRNSRESSVRKESDFSGVVVSLTPLKPASGQAISSSHATLLQKNKRFSPHVLAVEVGTAIDFPNLDPIFHNAFSSYNGPIFDVGLYPPGTTETVRFTRPGVVRVFCNIHPSMSAVIVVLDTPYFAKTSMNGAFTINAPPGRYELRVFHERASARTLAMLTRTVEVAQDGLRLDPITISEAGYLPLPHTNKFGKPYAPEDDGHSVYPGVRK